MQIKTIIPTNRRRLENTTEGNLVMISIDGHDKRRNIWTMYDGCSGVYDKFITFEAFEPKGEENKVLIAVYTSPRDSHQYDRNLGVILSSNSYKLEFLGPRREEYSSLSDKLQKAGLRVPD